MLTPQGRRLDQPVVEELAGHQRLLLLCGRYEGFDERIRTDPAAGRDFDRRLRPQRRRSGRDGGHRRGDPAGAGRVGRRREQPQRFVFRAASGCWSSPSTRGRASIAGWKCPRSCLSGNHEEIARWREDEQPTERTRQRRADLLRDDATERVNCRTSRLSRHAASRDIEPMQRSTKGTSHEPTNPGPGRKDEPEGGQSRLRDRRHGRRAHPDSRRRQGAHPDLHRRGHRPQRLRHPRDVHRPPDRAGRRRRAKFPLHSPRIAKIEVKRSASSAAPSSTSSAIASARPSG